MKTETEVQKLERLKTAGLASARAEQIRFLTELFETAETPELRRAARSLLMDELLHVTRIGGVSDV